MAKTKQTPDPMLKPVALSTQIQSAERDYLNTLLAQAQAAQTAMQSFGDYLAGRYQLAEGDSVTPDGQIVRKAA